MRPVAQSKVGRVSAVIAKWCPHCYLISVDNARKMAEDLDVALQVLDIDDENDGKVADDLVRNYGDDALDYLVPQIFLEFKNGSVQHIFTGFSENASVTKKHWEDLFSSEFFSELKARQN